MSRHASFDHQALVYDDDAQVAADAAALIDRCVSTGGHALVCLPERLVEQLEPVLRHEASVTFRAVDDRYRRPIDATHQLWTFVRDRLGAGATHALSIGELPVMADTDLDAWLWYEAAVADALADHPVRAVCLLDATVLPLEHRRQLEEAHRPSTPMPPMPVVDLPSTTPTSTLVTNAPRRARDMVASAADAHGASITDDARLVVSELVTNAVRHARSAATVSVWVTGDAVTVRVVDDGTGLHDPAAALRPPRLPHRGAGLWLCHHLADRFSIHDRPIGGCEARAVFTHRR